MIENLLIGYAFTAITFVILFVIGAMKIMQQEKLNASAVADDHTAQLIKRLQRSSVNIYLVMPEEVADELSKLMLDSVSKIESLNTHCGALTRNLKDHGLI